MYNREIEKILASAERLRLREEESEPWTDNYSDMNSKEKSMLLDELFALRKADKEREAKLLEKLDRMTEQLLGLNENSQMQMKQDEEQKQVIANLQKQLEQLQKQLELVQKENAALKEQNKLARKNLYGSKSQKISSRKRKEVSKEEEKDGFDGSSTPGDSSCVEPENSARAAVKEERPYRKGMSYKRMKADKSVCHESDLSKLPHGALVIKTFYKYAYEQVSYILEHRYQVVRYKTPDGKIMEEYLPKEKGPGRIDVVPGTHASGDFLAHLAFNHFVLNVPYYREMYRLNDHSMSLSRMTLVNWLAKGASFTTKLVDALKAAAMEKDSIVNCDETWCKVKVCDSYYKKYVWCLVNKEQKTVIYCYEDGSRGRKALKEILGDRKIKALQSDGYNVYMYLDDELVDTEHICCMAHARAKFVYAFEQSGDKDAKYIIDCMGELYGQEEQYRQGKLSPGQITQCRRSLKTMEIIGRLRSKLDALTAENHPPRGELMEKAVNYLKKFWNRLFNYLNDGRYSIDNSIAERFIRPLAGERKNSLFFGSSRMANVSAAYHTLISTCRMNGIPALDYLKKFFREIVNGRRDYENLLPMTIGISTNNI